MTDLASRASVSFQIGNVELTNLIVQDQVTKIQAKIATLQEEIDAGRDRLEEMEKRFDERVQALATEKWSDKIKQLACLLWEFGFAHMDVNEEAGQTPEEAFEEYDLTFQFQRDVIFLTRSMYDRQWTEEDVANPPFEIQVGFRIYKSWTVGGATRTAHVSLPLQERAGYERIPVHLPEDCRDLLREARQLNLDIHSLCKQSAELGAHIQDTGNIEKKVLAALTQKTLALNPELMNQIGDIVGTVEGTLPLLSAGS